jgi:hypothetical protein
VSQNRVNAIWSNHDCSNSAVAEIVWGPKMSWGMEKTSFFGFGPNLDKNVGSVVFFRQFSNYQDIFN